MVRVAAVIAGVAAAVSLAVCSRGHSGPHDPRDVTEAQARSLGEAIDLYAIEQGALPNSLRDLLTTSRRSGSPYMASDAEDGWSHPFAYRVASPVAGHYSIRSPGPDGDAGTSDDLAWERTAHLGR